MIAARSLVVIVVVLHKLRCLLGQRVNNAASHRRGIVKTLLGHRLTGSMARLLLVLAIEIAISADAGHIIHRRGHGSLDACVGSRSIQGDATPTTDADDTYLLSIDIVLFRQKINGCQEVLSIDVRRSRATRFPTALTRIGRVEGQCDKTTLRHPHGIESATLLLHGSERTTDSDGRKFLNSINFSNFFRCIEICRQCQTILCFKRHLLVIYLLAQREHLVPLLRQCQFLFHIVVCSLFVTVCAACQYSAQQRCDKYRPHNITILPFFINIPLEGFSTFTPFSE